MDYQTQISDMMTRVNARVQEMDYSALSKVQKECVTTDESRVLVVASAGSGKTRVLTERVKYLLLEKKVNPSSIVAITFTNLAAEEMKDRLANVTGISDCFIGTIHSFANRIYASSGKEYEIFSEDKDNEFMKYLIETYCKFIKFDRYLAFKDLQVKAESGLIDDSELSEFLLPTEVYELNMISYRRIRYRETQDQAQFDAIIREIDSRDYPEDVRSLCKKYHVIDFDELIKIATEYYKSLGASIEYILVDELQDIGSIENSFIKNLDGRNYFFVGDDWQSIYGFKGGNVNIFKGLIRDKNWKKFYLTENYRNAQSIIDVGNMVISSVEDRVKKKITCKRGIEGNFIQNSKSSLPEYLSLIKEHGNYGDYFLLARSNKDLMMLASIMDTMGIPYASFRKSEKSLLTLKAEMQTNKIKLLTVHTAKGLESKNVILYGNFPITVPSYMRNMEERRVMYVGVTRAEDLLILLN